MPPWKASSEAMLTMAPPACRAKAARAKAWERKKTALRLTSMTSSQSASVKSTASARRMMPALLTRMSTGPSVGELAGGGDRRVEGELERPRRQALGGDQREGRVERRAAGGDHLGPGAGHAEGDRLADAGVGAGDERDLAVEAEGVAHRSASIATMSMSRVVDVVAGHRPDEGVGLGAGAGVDRPGRRDRALLVGEDEVAGLARLAHQVEDAGGLGRGRCRDRPPSGGRGRARAWCSRPSRARGGSGRRRAGRTASRRGGRTGRWCGRSRSRASRPCSRRPRRS